MIKQLKDLSDNIKSTDIITAPSAQDQTPSLSRCQQKGKIFPFPRLPAELRLRVWALNLPKLQAQILAAHYRADISVSFHRKANTREAALRHSPPGCWELRNERDSSRLFTNLYICRESRHECLRSRIFSEDWEFLYFQQTLQSGAVLTQKAWMNVKIDTLLLSCIRSHWPVHIPLIAPYTASFGKRLQHLVVDDLLCFRPHRVEFLTEVLRKLRDIKKFDFSPSGYTRAWYDFSKVEFTPLVGLGERTSFFAQRRVEACKRYAKSRGVTQGTSDAKIFPLRNVEVGYVQLKWRC